MLVPIYVMNCHEILLMELLDWQIAAFALLKCTVLACKAYWIH